jgi:hypothetical protein
VVETAYTDCGNELPSASHCICQSRSNLRNGKKKPRKQSKFLPSSTSCEIPQEKPAVQLSQTLEQTDHLASQ